MKRQNTWIYFTAGLISVFFSTWFALRETVINPDAICYLQSAADMHQGLSAAMHLCDQASWPFYSALIYGWVQLTHVSFQTAAYSLDGFFSLVSVLTFLAIVNFIAKKPRVLWFALLAILLSHEFNSVRQYIVRDHGYWAFYLLSIYFLLHYFREYRYRYAVLWSASLIIATLFRVEGAIFLLAAPFLVWFDTRPAIFSRFISFLKLNTLLIVFGGVGVLALLLHFNFDVSRLHEISFQFVHGGDSITQHFGVMKQSLAKDVLNADSVQSAGLVLFITLASWYLLSVITNLSVIYTVLVVYAWVRNLLAVRGVRLVLWGYVVINVLVTAGFFAEHLFLSKRYLIALTLILMIWVPFALDGLLAQWKVRRWPFSLVLALMILSSLGGIFDFGYSKKYIHDAGQWIEANVPQNATLYSNDYQVMYYSGHFGNSIFNTARDYVNIDTIANGKWNQYQYIALRLDQKELANPSNVVHQINYTLVQVFQNKRGDQVRVYRRNGL